MLTILRKQKRLTVSIPYRLATNFVLLILTDSRTRFQFLIGWLQTITSHKIQVFSFKFQFLIGWLQTRLYKFATPEPLRFQFLIGWLQTRGKYGRKIPPPEFQFLIGWLQTICYLSGGITSQCRFNSLQVGYKLSNSGYVALSEAVSIPYRLATN